MFFRCIIKAMASERYQVFVAQVNRKRQDTMPADEEFAADNKEIGCGNNIK